MNTDNIIKEQKGTIVDVRTPAEFRRGNVTGSINIPLQEIPQRINELKGLKQPLVLCCASGNRSGQAHSYLAQQGIESLDGGSWINVNDIKNQSKEKVQAN